LLRVLQIVASPGWGGLEQAVVELSNELAETCEVHAMVPAEASFRDRFAPGVTLHPLPEGSRRNPLTALRLARSIERISPDVVHAHAARAVEMVWWARRISPGRLAAAADVATKHNTRTRRIFDRVKTVTAVSAAAAGTIRDAGRVVVVPNGIRVRSVSPLPLPDVFTFIAVGRLDRYKGFDRLVDAVAALTFPFRLLLVGEGGERGRIEARVAELGLGDRVEFTGHRDDVPELLAGAHVQVVPSRSEGFGLVIIEGLHYAHLLVSTPVGVATEVLPSELLLDPPDLASELARVHEEYDDLRALFSSIAAQRRERFTWRAAAEGYRAVYERARSA
jgi:glycosyltransferase involved in cell wall biosynthesis